MSAPKRATIEAKQLKMKRKRLSKLYSEVAARRRKRGTGAVRHFDVNSPGQSSRKTKWGATDDAKDRLESPGWWSGGSDL